MEIAAADAGILGKNQSAVIVAINGNVGKFAVADVASADAYKSGSGKFASLNHAIIDRNRAAVDQLAVGEAFAVDFTVFERTIIDGCLDIRDGAVTESEAALDNISVKSDIAVFKDAHFFANGFRNSGKIKVHDGQSIYLLIL